MSLVYIIINILIFIAFAPLFEGLIRRITARVQSRKGPPLIQPYYDILKLLGKENIDSAGTWAFKIAPMMALASILSVVALVPVAGKANFLSQYADIISVIYMLTLGGVACLLGALASRNTYALMGASREMVTMLMVEPVLAMVFIFGAIKIHSLTVISSMSGVAATGYGWSVALMIFVYLLALQAFVARQPFDIPEAEIEILEGPFIEYSGPNYALFKFYMMIKQMFYAFLFVAIFVPGLQSGVFALDLLVQLAATAAVFVLIGLLASTNPRFRIDQAVKYYAVLIVMSLCAIGLSVYGI